MKSNKDRTAEKKIQRFIQDKIDNFKLAQKSKLVYQRIRKDIPLSQNPNTTFLTLEEAIRSVIIKTVDGGSGDLLEHLICIYSPRAKEHPGHCKGFDVELVKPSAIADIKMADNTVKFSDMSKTCQKIKDKAAEKGCPTGVIIQWYGKSDSEKKDSQTNVSIYSGKAAREYLKISDEDARKIQSYIQNYRITTIQRLTGLVKDQLKK
ncbi:MAG: hypothetical protein VX278_00920 [Myxococcota bacterium]|nr:hypothetical protein [Myxococcota bacterium]